MKRISKFTPFFFAIAMWLAAARPVLAEPPPTQDGNRFLFVVDTAYAMRHYSNEIVQTVVDLLDSDMRGEFRKGDTVGLWTYTDKLRTDYPMQIWSNETRSSIAADMGVYLQGRTYEKQAHLDRVLPVLNQVIRGSQRLTVILIFDGSGSIQGTHFDKDINALQKKYARELRAAHVPFVTVLAARDGAVFDYTINYPGLIAIPHTALPEPVAETNAPLAATSTPVTNAPVQSKPSGSLILSGTKKAFSEAPAPEPAPEVVKTPGPTPAIVNQTAATPPPAVVTPTPSTSQPTITAVAPPPQTFAPLPAPQPVQPATPPVAARQNPEPPAENPAAQTLVAPAPAGAQSPPSSPPAAPAAAAEVALPGLSPLALFGMALSLLTVGVVLAIYLVRRARNGHQPSLISQSLDRTP